MGSPTENSDAEKVSSSAPAIAGAGALVRQYFEEGWYPSGTEQPADALDPSGALVKAVLLQASRLRARNTSGYADRLDFDTAGVITPQVGVDRDFWQLVGRYEQKGVV